MRFVLLLLNIGLAGAVPALTERSAAIADRRRRWPNGTVPYEISSEYPAVVQNIFQEAMNEIETKTKVNGKTCIHFQPHNGEKAFVKFVTGNGCHAPVGYIGRQSSITIGHGCERKGTVLHEILHVLGFWHEENRPDRDQYVKIHYRNNHSLVTKYPAEYVDTLGLPYDYDSIMSTPQGIGFTIEALQPGVTIGQRKRLSPIDVKGIQLLYDCIKPLGHSGQNISGFVTAAPPSTAKPPAGSDLCTFEHGMCGWTQSHSDQTQWRRHNGSTPSQHTGPHTDPHGSHTAHYLYIEASGHKNQSAKLDSKAYPGGDYCLDFYYHMYGSDMGYLRINVFSGNQAFHLKTISGNHGDHWVHQRVHAHIHTNGTFHFELEGHTGNNYHSDIAVDDIMIHKGSC